MSDREVPAWAAEVLEPSAFPHGITETWHDGILQGPVQRDDPSIQWYEAKGGSNFGQRTQIPFTMTSLDTPLYHELLMAQRPPDRMALVADVGAGDGRNTLPFLDAGYQRVVAVEPVGSSLWHLREQAEQAFPDAGQRLLCIQGDVRQLPLRSGIASLVLAIESLYYLNEEHGLGLAECGRVLASSGRLVLADRAWEGTLLTSLLYGGVEEMLRVAAGRSMWDGAAETGVRTRTFTEEEILQAVTAAGLRVLENHGLSVLSVVFGFLRSLGRISDADHQHLPKVVDLLRELKTKGGTRRVHVIVAARN